MSTAVEWQAWMPLWAFSPFLGAIAWSDFVRMRIPNSYCLAGVAVFLAALPLIGHSDALLRAALALACFAACFGLFALGWLGGGDAKILPVMMLVVPPAAASAYMLLMAALMAAGLALMPALRRLLGEAALKFASTRQSAEFPMGVAIGGAGLVLAAFSV